LYHNIHVSVFIHSPSVNFWSNECTFM
jgi:hypothetical protein